MTYSYSMKENKLIQQLKLLSAEEFKQFYPFLRSTYFTNSKGVVKMFEWLRKFYPNFDAKQLNKATLFQKLFPKQTYSDIKLRNLFTKLNKILESYLIQKYYEQHAYEKKKILTQIYGSRNYYSEFKKGTTQLLTALETQPYRDADYYFKKYLLEKAYYFHVGTSKHDGMEQTLKKAIENLDYFLGLERLFLGIDLKNRANIFAEQHNFNPTTYEFNIPPNNKLAQQFQLSFQLLENQRDETFLQLHELFLKDLESIRPYYSKVIFIILLNVAFRKTKEKETLFLDKLFQLYKVGSAKGLLLEGDKISLGLFFNAILVSAQLKKFEWGERFIEQYQKHLVDGKEKEIILQLAISNIRFKQGKYEEVIALLSTLNLFNIHFELNIRTLLIRTYFQLFLIDDSYYFLLINQCQAFDKLLQRDTTIDSAKKKGNQQFLKTVQGIADLILAKQLTNQSKLDWQVKVQPFKNMPHKGWLLEILDIKHK